MRHTARISLRFSQSICLFLSGHKMQVASCVFASCGHFSLVLSSLTLARNTRRLVCHFSFEVRGRRKYHLETNNVNEHTVLCSYLGDFQHSTRKTSGRGVNGRSLEICFSLHHTTTKKAIHYGILVAGF